MRYESGEVEKKKGLKIRKNTEETNATLSSLNCI